MYTELLLDPVEAAELGARTGCGLPLGSAPNAEFGIPNQRVAQSSMCLHLTIMLAHLVLAFARSWDQARKTSDHQARNLDHGPSSRGMEEQPYTRCRRMQGPQKYHLEPNSHRNQRKQQPDLLLEPCLRQEHWSKARTFWPSQKAYSSQTKHQLGVRTAVRAVRHNSYLITLSSLPRFTLAPSKKLTNRNSLFELFARGQFCCAPQKLSGCVKKGTYFNCEISGQMALGARTYT